VAQYIVLAVPAHELFGFVACQTKGAIVPIKNAAFPVNEIHAFTHVIKQIFIEARVTRNHLISALLPFSDELVDIKWNAVTRASKVLEQDDIYQEGQLARLDHRKINPARERSQPKTTGFEACVFPWCGESEVRCISEKTSAAHKLPKYRIFDSLHLFKEKNPW
jgi:hypothetical protein